MTTKQRVFDVVTVFRSSGVGEEFPIGFREAPRSRCILGLELMWKVAMSCLLPRCHVVEDERTSIDGLDTSLLV